MNFEIIHLKTVGSTNKFALEFVETSPIKNGLVIWADEQTAGRGYGENRWESEAGKNLTFSLVIKPLYIHPANQFAITQLVSVALQKTIKNITGRNDIRIKWPNDLYVGNKKLAGILIQNIIKGDEIDLSIIGIGLNVNQETFSPKLPNPVSIMQLTSKFTEREKLLNDFLQTFQNEYEKSGSPLFQEMIGKSYFEKMYLFNEWATYEASGEQFKGKILGVGPFGHLILFLENGEERQFGFKEVELILP
jgi:BirA family transcriptional regulator, biotin operon repressor / biotin---[acetyl-CoA-carboxylase] ligase